MRIPGFRGVSVRTVASETAREFMADDMLTYAAALAYQVFFSLFPFIIFLIALLSFLHIPGFFDWLLMQAATVLPQPVMEQVEQVITEVQDAREGGLLSLGILLAIWAASAGIRSTMNALNVAYDVEEGRPTWKRYLLSILYTMALAVIVIAATAMLMIGPKVMLWLAGHVGLGRVAVTLWAWLRIPTAILLLMLGVAVVYYAAPNVKQEFRYITPGSVLAVMLWVVASFGFSFYVSNIGNYAAMYGSIGTVIVFLLYIFLSALALLVGGELNAVIEHHAPATARPREKVPPAPDHAG